MAAPRRCCPKPRTRRDLRLEGLETRHLLSVEPLGDAFRVNTFVEGDQRAIESANSMAMGRDGNSVVVWQSQNQDGRPSSIRAQRLDPSGRPVGSEMRVDQNVPGFSLSSPSIATNDASGFVISWTSYSDNQLISGDVYSRVFSAAGEPLGDEFLVNNRQVNAQSHPAVAMDSDGDFVVAWSSCYQDTPGCDVYARRFDATGAPRADEARIANVNAQDLAKPSASMSDDGRYVIAWSQNDDIYAQLFAANGAVTRPAFVVNDYNFREQYAPAVAMNSTGEFVVAWNTFVPGGASHGTAARRFDALGQPLDTQIAVGHPPNTEGNVLNADISPDGSFVVAWTGRPNQVFVHGYDRNGIELAPALAVSETAVFGPHYGLAVGMSDDGFMIAWSYDNAGRDYDVYARRYAILPPPAPEIRIIGNRRDIVSGDDAPSLDDFTDFGAAVVPSGIIERTYVVSNEGAGPLVFSGSPRVEIQGAQAGDFRVTWPLPEAIPAGGSATFTIEFQPTQLGLRTAQVRIANDDADEAEFILAIQGIGRDTLAGEIHGAKWNDLNGDGALNEGEPGLADVIIYLDDDGDGRRDASERYTRSGLDGRYQFAGLAPGEYFVAEVLETGWRQTFPGEAHSNAHTVSLSASQIAAGIDFLNQLADPPPTARIDGLSLGSSQSSQSIQLGDGDAQLTNHLANAIDQIVIVTLQPSEVVFVGRGGSLPVRRNCSRALTTVRMGSWPRCLRVRKTLISTAWQSAPCWLRLP